jgi:hypothetical protein
MVFPFLALSIISMIIVIGPYWWRLFNCVGRMPIRPCLVLYFLCVRCIFLLVSYLFGLCISFGNFGMLFCISHFVRRGLFFVFHVLVCLLCGLFEGYFYISVLNSFVIFRMYVLLYVYVTHFCSFSTLLFGLFILCLSLLYICVMSSFLYPLFSAMLIIVFNSLFFCVFFKG